MAVGVMDVGLMDVLVVAVGVARFERSDRGYGGVGNQGVDGNIGIKEFDVLAVDFEELINQSGIVEIWGETASAAASYIFFG